MRVTREWMKQWAIPEGQPKHFVHEHSGLTVEYLTHFELGVMNSRVLNSDEAIARLMAMGMTRRDATLLLRKLRHAGNRIYSGAYEHYWRALRRKRESAGMGDQARISLSLSIHLSPETF